MTCMHAVCFVTSIHSKNSSTWIVICNLPCTLNITLYTFHVTIGVIPSLISMYRIPVSIGLYIGKPCSTSQHMHNNYMASREPVGERASDRVWIRAKGRYRVILSRAVISYIDRWV